MALDMGSFSLCIKFKNRQKFVPVCRYLNNGQAEIDNNVTERMMKLVCLGRKNCLFYGSNRLLKICH